MDEGSRTPVDQTTSGELRVGFVGAGGIAGIHAPNLAQLPGVRIAAVADVDADRARALASAHGAAAYADAAAMLDEAALDAVFICLPPFAHGDVIERAMARRLPVYVEKPVGLDLDAALRTADRIEEAGVVSAVGYMWRYSPAAARARELLGGAERGLLLGRMLNGPNAPAWSLDRRLSGGILVEFATHVADMLRYLGGEVARVSGAGAEVSPGPPSRGPDSAVLALTYASGAVGSLETTWAATRLEGEVRAVAPGADLSLDLVAERLRGVAAGAEVDFTASAPAGVRPHGFTGGASWYLGVEAFVRAVRAGDPTKVRSPYRDAVRTLVLTLAADEALRTGRVVDVPIV